jgi:hypothetical protein
MFISADSSQGSDTVQAAKDVVNMNAERRHSRSSNPKARTTGVEPWHRNTRVSYLHVVMCSSSE